LLKKVTAIFLSISLCFCITTVSAASTNSDIPTSGVQSSDPNHATGLYNTGSTSGISPMATGILAFVSLDLYVQNGNTLVLEGSTDGTEILNKIGYQDIALQRYQNGAWTNVRVWSTYKSNSSSYDYEYTTTVTGGYDYRFVATHYGEEDWLIFSSVQTIYNETSYVYIG
jgi:hypothetical protein